MSKLRVAIARHSRAALCGLLIGVVVEGVAAPASPSADIEPFFRRPDITEAHLSPSGRYLAATTKTTNGRLQLQVIDLEAGSAKIVAGLSRGDVNNIRWVNEDWLVFDSIDLRQGSGQNRGMGLWSARRDGETARSLIDTNWNATRTGSQIMSRVLTPDHYLHSVPTDGSNEVLVTRARFNAAREFEAEQLFRLDVVTGQIRSVGPTNQPPGVIAWLVDRTGEPRVVTTRADGRLQLHWRDPASGDWHKLAEGRGGPDLPFWPMYIDYDGSLLVSAHHGPDAVDAIFRYDVTTRRLAAQPLISAAGFDVRGQFELDQPQRRVVGLHYVTDAHSAVWFVPEFAQLQRDIDKQLPGRVNQLSCGDCLSSPRVLIKSWSDREPPVFWLYERAKGELRRVGASRGWIDPRRMALQDFVRTRARDGLSLPVYVTRPAQPAKGPWPTVVLVHGGPWVRGNSWGWNADAQFLASRGYLVVEPEFRGGEGFGQRHLEAGWKQWGLAMQDDVADAVQWAVSQRLADPRRIAIAGASYGGYATMMGLVRHPEVYRCGINWVGVTDIDLMYSVQWSDTSEWSKTYSLPERIGDPVKDAEQLARTSPIRQASKVRVPVLLAYGGADRRVPIVHGERLRDALRENKVEVEWVVYGEEGHGWLKTENEVDFWGRVDRFLGRCLAPDVNSPSATPAS